MAKVGVLVTYTGSFVLEFEATSTSMEAEADEAKQRAEHIFIERYPEADLTSIEVTFDDHKTYSVENSDYDL